MKIFPFQAIYPNFELISSPEHFFSSVKYDYPEYEKNGFFQSTRDDSVYIYQIETKNRNHLGLIGCVDIQAYLNGQIVKHEKTLASKEQTMMQLLLQRQAMVKPVLLGYEPQNVIRTEIQSAIANSTPFFSIHFEEENQKHHFFRVKERVQLHKIISLFDKHVPYSYIADGHHRCATSAKLYQTQIGKTDGPNKYQHLLCALFPFDQLEIHDYNRVVEALGDISPIRLMAELSKVFFIKFVKKPAKPKSKHELTMYIQHEWYRLRWRPEILKKYQDEEVLLDTFLLNQEVMKKIIGVKDSGKDPRIKYVEGITGLQGLIDRSIRSAKRFGFCLYPISNKEWVSISKEGNTLPPKSTWFEPRIRNGLIVKAF